MSIVHASEREQLSEMVFSGNNFINDGNSLILHYKWGWEVLKALNFFLAFWSRIKCARMILKKNSNLIERYFEFKCSWWKRNLVLCHTFICLQLLSMAMTYTTHYIMYTWPNERQHHSKLVPDRHFFYIDITRRQLNIQMPDWEQ